MEKMLESRVNEYKGAHAISMQHEDDAIRNRLAAKGQLNSGLYIRQRIELFDRLLSGFKDKYGQERPSLPDLYQKYFEDFPQELTADVIKEIVDWEKSYGEKVSKHIPDSILLTSNNEGIKRSWENSVSSVFNKVAQQTGMKLGTLLKKHALAKQAQPSLPVSRRSDRIKDVHDLISSPSRPTLRALMDEQIVLTASEQSDIYQVLFLVENFLRRFIEKRLRASFGVDFISKVSLGKDAKLAIATRKKQEEAHSWLKARGDSDLFYLDFDDLGFVIKNNWASFADAFPEQQWIDVKIEELYKCRCLIAHNSIVGEHEIDVVLTNSKSIFLQLADK